MRRLLALTYTVGMRHLIRGRRLPSGRMSNETWCGSVPVAPPAARVLDVECVPCLDAIIEAADQARRRKAQLAKDVGR